MKSPKKLKGHRVALERKVRAVSKVVEVEDNHQ
jgi:hypothetical protein